MNNQITTISNAVVYANGICQSATAEEVKLPVVKMKMTERKALGAVGTIKVPQGLEALEGEIKWGSFDRYVWGQILNPDQPVSLQIRASAKTVGSQGVIEEVPLVVFLTATFNEVPLGEFKQNDNVEFSSKFNATYVKQVFNGSEILEVDVLANIYKVNGQDVLAKYRANVGLTL